MSRTSDDSQILDFDHLRRQTAGDCALERELLALFARQCARLGTLIRDGASRERADAAHTLKGSAWSIGAWRLASVAERLETGLRSGEAAAPLMVLFDEAVEATRRALAERERARAG